MSMRFTAAPFPGAAVFSAAIAAAAGLLVPAVLVPALAGPGAVPSHDKVVAAARRIQNACFATYPPELLLRLTGSETVPAEVRDDPALQMKAFTRTDRREKGLFYPTSLDDTLDAFESEVRPGLKLLDLGSGDGRVVFLSAVLGADATGIEWEPSLHRLALDARKRLGSFVPRGRAHLRQGDFLREDFSRYDLLFYFGSGSFDDTALFDKIRRELRPGARLLFAHETLPPSGLDETASYGVVKVYVQPAGGSTDGSTGGGSP
ncbi:MAG TPA: class I SAM-dependent methyltransferase [Candidatus Polarisedimenticolia bacterium]|nr:class I SAM-dependent methyltransferase [Candidatus Polarisedimenticolia bacterium]